MAKVKIEYQTTLYYVEEIEVPDELIKSKDSQFDCLSDEGWDYVRERVSYHDEVDCDTEFVACYVQDDDNV